MVGSHRNGSGARWLACAMLAAALALTQAHAVAFTILDEEGAALGGPGWGGNSNEGYNRDIRYSNDATATATWTFTGLADGQYDVLASWTLHANRSSDVSYTVGSNPAVHVNQEQHGTGIYMQGSPVSTSIPHLLNYLDGPRRPTTGRGPTTT